MAKGPQFGGGFSDAEFSVAEALTAESLNIVEQRYGSGYPYFSGGVQPLCYHNKCHSVAVSEGADKMGEAFGLSRTARAIGRLAGGAHDIIQLKPRGVMEQESADWLSKRMRQEKFGAISSAIAHHAILGTEPIFENGNLRQRVSELKFPSKEAELVALSVACADLGELYSPLGPRLAHELFKEIKGLSPYDQAPMSELLEFQRGQVKLVHNYKYPHSVGEDVFGGLRPQIIEYHEDLLYLLERGEITTWAEVMEADENFRWTFS